jgi:hypothetical protein
MEHGPFSRNTVSGQRTPRVQGSRVVSLVVHPRGLAAARPTHCASARRVTSPGTGLRPRGSQSTGVERYALSDLSSPCITCTVS